MASAIILLIIGLIIYFWGKSSKQKYAQMLKNLGMVIAIIGGAITVLGIIIAVTTV